MNVSTGHTQTLEEAKPPGTSELHSELARLCLPSASREAYQRFAWANSLCAGVLIIGIIGLFPKKLEIRNPPPLEEIIPVVYTPPPEPPKVEPQVLEKEPDPTTEPTDMPQVVAVVAANSKAVAFSVPVEGPVQIVPVRAAAPPPPPGPRAVAPPKQVGPPKVMNYSPGSRSEGYTPDMTVYPPEAQRRHEQGEVRLQITVEEDGSISSIEIQKGAGSALDRATKDYVMRVWRFKPGSKRIFIVPFEYRLTN